MKFFSLFLAMLIAHPAICATSTEESNWLFRILLDDKEIGYHTYSIVQQDSQLTIRSDAKMDVKFLFLNAFRYRHNDVQTWNNNCLTSIDASTTSNNKQFNVSGNTRDSGLTLSSHEGAVNLDQCVKTFAYWNPDILKADTLLNSQTGEYVKIKATPVGADTIVYDGHTIEAKKYRIQSLPGAASTAVDLTIWYSTDNMQWLALESIVKGGRVLRYQPLKLPAVSMQHDDAQVAALAP